MSAALAKQEDTEVLLGWGVSAFSPFGRGEPRAWGAAGAGTRGQNVSLGGCFKQNLTKRLP